jgi:hypothetical protein
VRLRVVAGRPEKLAWVFPAGAALLASLPLLAHGLARTHDGPFHLFRLQALQEALRWGCLYPRWLPDLAFGYGQPVFSFYGPVLYYLGVGLAAAGLGALAALKVTLGATSALGALGVYALARRHECGAWGAALAGVGYALFPYRLANLHVRGAFAEHLGLALAPWLLLCASSLLGQRGVAVAGAMWAFAILSHSLTAFMMLPLWVLFAALLHGRKAWRRVCASLGLGLGLSGFHWLPMVWEARHVGLGHTFSTDAWARYLYSLRQSLSWGVPYSYSAEHKAPAALALVLIALLVAGGWRGFEGRLRPLLAFAVVGAFASWFMTLRASSLLWRYLPFLGYLQFPWRWLGPFALCWSLALGATASFVLQGRSRAWRLAATVAALLVLGAYSLLRLPAPQVVPLVGASWKEAMWAYDTEIGQAGTTWTAEYMPVWVKVDRSILGRDPIEADAPPRGALPAGSRVTVLRAGPWAMELRVDLPAEVRLSFHSFHYPGFRVWVDGRPAQAEPTTALGLLSTVVPAGQHMVRVGWADTAPATAGRALASCAGAVAGAALFSRRSKAAGGLAGLGAGLALWCLAGSCGQVRAVEPVWASFEGELALVGWRAPRLARAGAQLKVELWWVALQTPEEDYKVFVHLVSADGQLVSQSDGDPVGGFTPTRRMVAGQVSWEERWLPLPAHPQGGPYRLEVGLYRWPSIVNLAVTEGPGSGGDRVTLAPVEIR